MEAIIDDFNNRRQDIFLSNVFDNHFPGPLWHTQTTNKSSIIQNEMQEIKQNFENFVTKDADLNYRGLQSITLLECNNANRKSLLK